MISKNISHIQDYMSRNKKGTVDTSYRVVEFFKEFYEKRNYVHTPFVRLNSAISGPIYENHIH